MNSRREDLQHLTEFVVRRLVSDCSSRLRPREECLSRLRSPHPELDARPWGAWFLLWDPIGDDEMPGDEFKGLKAAWFMTSSGYTRRDVWSYARAERLTTPSFNLYRELATLQIAPCRDRLGVYATALYGGRNGYGFLVEINAQGDYRLYDRWRS